MNLRPPTEDEIPQVAELYNAVSRTLYGIDVASERALRTWFNAPTTDVARNLRVADEDGTVIGYADVDPRSSEPTRCWAEEIVRRTGDFEPVAAALLDWVEQRAAEETDPVIRMNVWEKDDAMR